MQNSHLNLEELQKRRQIRLISEKKQTKDIVAAGTTSCSDTSSSLSSSSESTSARVHPAPLKRSRSESESLSSNHTRVNNKKRPSKIQKPSERSKLVATSCMYESDDEQIFKPARGPKMSIRPVYWA